MASILAPRQPFGLVSQVRLRNLTNAKNKQNAIPSKPAKSLKRAYESDSSASDNDNENIDPIIWLSNKKAKGSDGLAKPQNSTIGSTKSTSDSKTRPIAKARGLKVETRKAATISAPAGGRSPTRKYRGIGSRRRDGNTQVKVPSFAKAGDIGMPFSLDAVLSDLVGNAPKAASDMVNNVPAATSSMVNNAPEAASDLRNGIPSRWDFVIYEDSPEEELNNLVQHSTQTLDISDDESKTIERNDRGKENVPPAGFIATAVARNDMMTEEIRTPLGDLNASDYYAAGLDANSVDIIPDDTESTFTFEAPKKVEVSELIKELSNKTCKPVTPIEAVDLSKEIIKSEEPFQIWDSGSDKES